ncbi:MAG: hypothetical protein AAGH41_11460 [Pseudomonadota bacterium]
MPQLFISGFEIHSFIPELPVNVLCDGKSIGRFGPKAPMPIDLPEGTKKVVLRQFFRWSPPCTVKSDDEVVLAKLNPLPGEQPRPMPHLTGAVLAFVFATVALVAPLEGTAIRFVFLISTLPIVLWLARRFNPELTVAFRRRES